MPGGMLVHLIQGIGMHSLWLNRVLIIILAGLLQMYLSEEITQIIKMR
jgi:hypothetical protein